MSVSFFPYPLQIGALEEFCHPKESHLFARPAYHDGQALAGNGYILIRVHRGLWLPADLDKPTDQFLVRFQAAPWWMPIHQPSDWRSLDEIKGSLFRFALHGIWSKGKCAPSPVWRVGAAFLARLSHLQMIARLPRCEVLIGSHGPSVPLHFRFSGGAGILAQDDRLREFSFSVFSPKYSHDGFEEKRRTAPKPNFHPPPPPEPPLDDWPPPEASDDQPSDSQN